MDSKQFIIFAVSYIIIIIYSYIEIRYFKCELREILLLAWGIAGVCWIVYQLFNGFSNP